MVEFLRNRLCSSKRRFRYYAANDLAMHITQLWLQNLQKQVILTKLRPPKQKLSFQEELANLDKPADIKEKILQGKLNDFFAEKTLMNQPFVKNPELLLNNYESIKSKDWGKS
jgi:elongation factor Ts